MDPSASPDSKEAKDNARDLVFTRRPPTSAPEDLGETAVTRQRISPHADDPGMREGKIWLLRDSTPSAGRASLLWRLLSSKARSADIPRIAMSPRVAEIAPNRQPRDVQSRR